MKKSIMFSLIMLTTVFVFAQRGGGASEAKIQKKVDRMTEQLDLSIDQQTQIKSLLETQQKSRKTKSDKKEMSDTERATMKEARKASRATYNAKLAEILSSEQKATYQNLKKNNKRKGKGHADRKTPEERTQKRVSKLTEELNLSEIQQAQLTALMAGKTKSKKGKEKKEMTEEERATMKAERKAYKKAYNTKFEQILTPEQLAIYKANKAKKKGKNKEQKMNKKRAHK